MWTALFVSACTVLAPLQSESELEAGLVELRSQLARHAWSAADETVARLIAEHGTQPYIWLSLPELREAHVLATFAPLYREPKPDQVVYGDLRSYSESTGALRLHLGTEHFDALRVIPPKYSFGDRAGQLHRREIGVEDPEMLRYPVVFSGPYSVELRGTDYSTAGPFERVELGLRLFLDDGETLRVRFGSRREFSNRAPDFVAATVRRFDGREWPIVELRPEPPCLMSKPFEFKVAVTDSRISVTWNGKPVLSTEKPVGKFGSFAIESPSGVWDVEIQGRVNTSFVSGLLDAHFQKAWMKHAASMDDANWLPASLRSLPAGRDEEPLPDTASFPEPLEERQRATVEKVLATCGGPGGFRWTLMAELARAGLSEANGAWLDALVAARLGERARARQALAPLRTGKPEFLPALHLDAWLAAQLGQHQQALELYRKLLGVDPTRDRVANEIADLALSLGQFDELLAHLRERAERGRFTRELEAFNHWRVRVRSGPQWDRSFSFESEHFVVASDIDLKTCREAATLLESSLSRFCDYLRPLPAGRGDRFRVFLFSGRVGYLRYAHEVLGTKPENTAGLYSPLLRQLLIWNLPQREEMFETIRHEGFHQYLHRWTEDAPIWLNEGLAEYFETAQFQRSASQVAQKRPDHLRTLGDTPVLPRARDFVRISRSQFHARSERNYAYAWALVHFLLGSGPENRRRFDRLFDELGRDVPSDEAVTLAFEGIDWAAFDAALFEHLGKLWR